MTEKAKILLLVRHAKSSWKDQALADHDRILNKRGERDAPRMGEYLVKNGYIPEKIITSSAIRALTTARILANELKYNLKNVVVDKNVYGAMPSQILKIIHGIDNNVESLMIIGHNPTITELVMQLTDHEIYNIPTCGIAIIQLKTISWSEIDNKCATLLEYVYPKKLI